MTATIEEILSGRPFLCVDIGNGERYQHALYSTDAFALMHAAMRMDAWLLRTVGYVPQDRVWWIEPALKEGGGSWSTKDLQQSAAIDRRTI